MILEVQVKPAPEGAEAAVLLDGQVLHAVVSGHAMGALTALEAACEADLDEARAVFMAVKGRLHAESLKMPRRAGDEQEVVFDA